MTSKAPLPMVVDVIDSGFGSSIVHAIGMNLRLLRAKLGLLITDQQPRSYALSVATSGVGSRVIVAFAIFAIAGTSTLCAAGDTSGTHSQIAATLHSCSSGDLLAKFELGRSGVQLFELRDRATDTPLVSRPTQLFSLVFRRPNETVDVTLSSTSGWQRVSCEYTSNGCVFAFNDPTNGGIRDLSVRLFVRTNSEEAAFEWRIGVENVGNAMLRRIVFPSLVLADLGEDSAVLFPRGPGEVQQNVWRKSFNYRGDYPGGWCAMQFVAVYRTGEKPTGLYVGFHDPFGSSKFVVLKTDPTNRELHAAFEVPVPNMTVPGNDFKVEGAVVWQLFRGDWFDAARIYKRWASSEAKWWPKLGPNGRQETPEWMRKLNVWVMTGGAPAECVPAVKAFRDLVDIPVGFHWYNWHQIPFDNDYPHYFPTKPGFADAVAQLQQAGVFVMPYINGRLWDSRDRGTDDFQFTTVALPATTKKEDGQPFLETYGSKETNGEPVRLAVMCPATQLWQDKVHDIVLNLLVKQGTRAVYIDQIAAAAPVLCSDKTHSHPTGGGHWWNEGYWTMLERIRSDMPPDRALTTECNGEPFIRWMDGYLTWHWQHDGQVPAFPAVYGGTIQMFGRAYRGGPTKDLALRMKAAQQLVFGEQIGWFDPNQASEPQNFPFIRKVVMTRDLFKEYFYSGQMARPAKLSGQIPKLRADWQWSGEWWVTTDAVLTGAWEIATAKKLVLLFVNPGDQPVTASLAIEPAQYNLPAGHVTVAVVRDAGQPEYMSDVSLPLKTQVEVPAQTVTAWEIRSR